MPWPKNRNKKLHKRNRHTGKMVPGARTVCKSESGKNNDKKKKEIYEFHRRTWLCPCASRLHGRQCTHRPIYICILPKFTCCSAVVTLPLHPPGWYRAPCASLLSCRTIHFLPSCMHASFLSFILSLSLLFLHPATLSLSIGLPSSGISLTCHPRSPSFSLCSNVRKWILYLARNSFRKVLLARDRPCKHTRVQLCASM